jgi:predicted MPP superfamily phosphohydrolase
LSRPWRLARGLAIAAAAAALVAAADATMVEPFRLTTSLVDLDDGPLADRLRGGRIVHLSDLHFRGMGLRERGLLERLKRIDPALIVMTGDYADSAEGIEALRELFASLHPSMGIYAVPGNNDYFRGRQEEIFGALREAGVRLLINEVATVDAPGGPVAIAGVDDPFFGRDDLGALLAGIPPGMPAVLLAHSPSILLDRSDAMLFNAGDADGPWGEGAFWTDGSHFREQIRPVRFERAGEQILTIQVREDGVGLTALRLVPAGPNSIGAPLPRGLQGVGRRSPRGVAGTIEIDLCAADVRNEKDGWRLIRDETGSCRIEHSRDSGRLESLALADPPDRVTIAFEAPAGVGYRTWALLESPDSSGLSDSLYIQYDRAVDASGAPAYRTGASRPGAGGPPLDLILAGHTHGGQVRIPWIGPMAWELIPGGYVSGRYDAGGSMVYVSRGIGTSILPVRFACAPEIVVLGEETGGEGS